MKIIGIMASTDSGVIGLNGKIPWRYTNELEHFQKVTKGQTVVMGRKTFNEMENLKLLEERKSVVFTRSPLLLNKNATNIRFVNSLNAFTKLNFIQEKKIYMIGGSEIAELFFKKNMLEKFLLTKIHKEYDGDTYFPLSLIKEWRTEKIIENKNYNIYQYKPVTKINLPPTKSSGYEFGVNACLQKLKFSHLTQNPQNPSHPIL